MNQHAQIILETAIHEAMPASAVRQALREIPLSPDGRLIVVAVGKAAWEMAAAAQADLGDRIDAGIVMTKYGLPGDRLPA